MKEQLASYHEPQKFSWQPYQLAWTTWLLELSGHSQVIENVSKHSSKYINSKIGFAYLATYSYMRTFMNTTQWNQTTAFFSMFTDEIRWTEEITVTALLRNCL